ncbi:hypothetical protein EDB85DRAFT_900485 [Lactarius pseudohatsudake]|nr:hypothetical protein EDB85DRAFT_900485 [Lactarius pseudohatsudake]
MVPKWRSDVARSTVKTQWVQCTRRNRQRCVERLTGVRKSHISITSTSVFTLPYVSATRTFPPRFASHYLHVFPMFPFLSLLCFHSLYPFSLELLLSSLLTGLRHSTGFRVYKAPSPYRNRVALGRPFYLFFSVHLSRKSGSVAGTRRPNCCYTSLLPFPLWSRIHSASEPTLGPLSVHTTATPSQGPWLAGVASVSDGSVRTVSSGELRDPKCSLSVLPVLGSGHPEFVMVQLVYLDSSKIRRRVIQSTEDLGRGLPLRIVTSMGSASQTSIGEGRLSLKQGGL